MKSLSWLAVALAAVPALAGCAHAPASASASASGALASAAGPGETLVTGNATAAAVLHPKDGPKGHLAGIVVDEAIRPISGALVKVTNLGLQTRSDRDGAFGFVDLAPGPYFLTFAAPGFRPAEAVLTVQEGEFTRAKVVLTAIPPPQPYHVTQKFDGFANVSAAPYPSGALVCGTCSFVFSVDDTGLRALVLEANFDGPDAGTSRSFYVRFYAGASWTLLCILCTSEVAPVRDEVHAEDLDNETSFTLEAEPHSSPAPEVNVHFTVFVTAFYNAVPPTGWSLVAGDA